MLKILSQLTHELRNPTNQIKLFLEIIKDSNDLEELHRIYKINFFDNFKSLQNKLNYVRVLWRDFLILFQTF